MIKRIIITCLLLVILAPFALIAAIQYTDWSTQSARISSFLSDKFEQNIRVQGPVTLQVFPAPIFKVGGLEVAAYEGETPLVKMGEIEARADLKSLLSMHLNFESIKVATADVYLWVNEEGVKSWEPKRKSRRGTSGLGFTDFVTSYGESGIDAITVKYQNDELGKNYEITQGKLAVKGQNIADAKVNFNAIFMGEDLVYSGDLDLTSIASKIEFDESLMFKGQSFKAKGVMADPFGRYIANVKVEYQSEDALAFLSEFVNLGKDLPIENLKNVNFSGGFKMSATEFSSNKFMLMADGMALEGAFEVKDKSYTVDLTLKDTDTSVLGYKVSTQHQAMDKWSDDVIDLNILQGINLNAKLLLENVTHLGKNIESANVIFNLTDGMLDLTKLDVQIKGGKIDVAGRVDMGTPLRAKLKGQIESLKPTDWYAASWVKPFDVTLNGSYDLSFKGVSIAQMMRYLSGEMSLKVTDAKIAGFDPKNLTKTAEAIFKHKKLNNYTALEDFDLEAKIDNGVLRTENLKVVALGKAVLAEGKLDIGNRAVNYKLKPQELGLTELPVSIKGSLTQPEIITELPAGAGVMPYAQTPNMEQNAVAPQPNVNAQSDALPFDLEDPEKLRESLQKFLNDADQ